MQILGIDYGRKKIGVALSGGSLAEPICVLRKKTQKEMIKALRDLVDENDVEKIVVGVSEGEMGEEAKVFGEKIKHVLQKPVVFQDETLSTKDAQRFSIEAGIKRKKRKEMEDAYSAALVLQSYMDSR